MRYAQSLERSYGYVDLFICPRHHDVQQIVDFNELPVPCYKCSSNRAQPPKKEQSKVENDKKFDDAFMPILMILVIIIVFLLAC